jgi:propionyl-CoA/long-chain acyl-CoA carboxylase carboxyl transferase subunit
VSAAELESAGENVPDDIDIHTTAGKLADLERRVQQATHAGSERAVEKQHAAGKMTARERIDALLDPGSYTEFDEFARHRSANFGMDGPSRCSRRTSPCSAAASARSTARRS